MASRFHVLYVIRISINFIPDFHLRLFQPMQFLMDAYVYILVQILSSHLVNLCILPRTVIWNWPMRVFEFDKFAAGTVIEKSRLLSVLILRDESQPSRPPPLSSFIVQFFNFQLKFGQWIVGDRTNNLRF